MTMRQAERITGYVIKRLPHVDENKPYYYAAYGKDGSSVAECEGRRQDITLTRLVDVIYRLHSQIVFARAGWACEECGRRGVPLQIDHIVPRARGRNDRLENLRALDADCHARKHGGH